MGAKHGATDAEIEAARNCLGKSQPAQNRTGRTMGGPVAQAIKSTTAA